MHDPYFETVRTRIAPSPTGDPHVGTAYIGLFNRIVAKRHGGQFVLRIEDTDQVRSTKSSEEAILRSLRWLGLEWDEGPEVEGPYGPYHQSERTAIYQEHAQRLVDEGHAYPCFCTAERLVEMREDQKARKAHFKYDGLCRGIPEEEAKARIEAGEAHVIRLAIPEGDTITFTDALRGDIVYALEQLDDQILIKSDGFPTYHLANVVDDHLMKISHVIRAEEWIPSTPKHVLLYEAFGWALPVFMHMPLLRNIDKSKISKRKNPVSLDYFKRAGYLPEALLNFLANIGYSMGDDVEKFTVDELLESFDESRLSLGSPVFDMAKLDWLNGLYIRELDPVELRRRIVTELLSDEYLDAIVPLVQERIERLSDFVPRTSFFFSGLEEFPVSLLPHKKKSLEETVRVMERVVEHLDGVREWTHGRLEEELRTLADEIGWKAGMLFMPIRVATTGRKASPGLFETMEVIGKAMCQIRLRDAVRRAKEAIAAGQTS